jgi:hypothetical protein
MATYDRVYQRETFIGRIKRVYREKGLGYMIRASFRNPWIYYIKPPTYQLLFSFFPKPFSFRGASYNYLCHRFNSTWQNERAVEIPIAQAFVDGSRGQRILEVGHVLGHYGPVDHDVLDKYEPGEKIIHEDAATFRPSKKYDIIVSVSTMEHVGWDEAPRDPEALLRAFTNLAKNCLSPGGTLIVTVPLGYNDFLDLCLLSGRLRFDEAYYMKRVGPGRNWREAARQEVIGIRYDRTVSTAGAIAIGIIRKAQ